MRTLAGIANPDQLAELRKILDKYAADRGLAGDQLALDDLADRIMGLFNEGVTDTAEISRRLSSHNGRR